MMLDHWRARIGWIHPRVNSDIEVYDFYQAAPKDVVLVVTHLEVVDSARGERSKLPSLSSSARLSGSIWLASTSS